MALTRVEQKHIRDVLKFCLDDTCIELLVPARPGLASPSLCLSLRRLPDFRRALRSLIHVYVDGAIRPEWLSNDHPIGRRFYPLYDGMLSGLILHRALGSGWPCAMVGVVSAKNPNARPRQCWWDNVDRLVAHLVTNEPDIELVEED